MPKSTFIGPFKNIRSLFTIMCSQLSLSYIFSHGHLQVSIAILFCLSQEQVDSVFVINGSLVWQTKRLHFGNVGLTQGGVMPEECYLLLFISMEASLLIKHYNTDSVRICHYFHWLSMKIPSTG